MTAPTQCQAIEAVTQDSQQVLTGHGASKPNQRTRELLIFFALAFGIWPIVAVGVVGGYGFLVWMYQIVFGPPGPPGG